MRGPSSFPRCWQAPLQLALPVAAPAIRLHGIPARPLERFPHRLLPRALAVHFPALSRRLPLLQDRLRGQVGAVRPAAVVVVVAAAAGKRAAAPRVPKISLYTGTILHMLPQKRSVSPLADLRLTSAM